MSLSSHFNPEEPPTLIYVQPAFPRRLVAFVMDFILLSVLLQLTALFLPKIYGEEVEREFHNLILTASQLNPEDHFDTEKMAKFIRESGASDQTKEVIALIVVCALALPVTYCFIGEFFFSGKSLGKATFGMQALARQNGHPPRFFMALGRSMCKGLAILCILTPLFIPGLLNFFFALFNRDRRCLHDLLTGSYTAQAVFLPTASQEVSEDS